MADSTNLARGGDVAIPLTDPGSPMAGARQPVRLRTFMSIALALTVAACAGGSKVDKKYGVAPSPRVVKGSKIPAGGGRYMVGKPYKIAGKTYRPRHDPNYRATGMASWYGKAFHGRLTANGEVYDMNRLSAAHTTMPLPSYARVTNTKNGRSVIVRVNDRGPFSRSREIDLSQRTAELLDFKKDGLAKVKVEYVGKARLDGRDDEFLMASYRGPGAGNTSYADLDRAPRGTVVAAAMAAEPPRVRRRQVATATAPPASSASPRSPAPAYAPATPTATAGGSLDDDMLGFNGYSHIGPQNGVAGRSLYGNRGTRIITEPRPVRTGPVPPQDLPRTGLAGLSPSYAPESRIDKAFLAIGELFR